MSSMVDFVFSCFCRQPTERCFIVDLLRQVVVSSTEEVIFFFVILGLKSLIPSFFSPELVFFSNKVIYCTLISVCLYFSLFFFFLCFYRQPIVKCFVTDLLRQVVVSSTVGFFMVFRVGSSVDKVLFDKVIVSNYDHRCAVGILGILSIFILPNV